MSDNPSDVMPVFDTFGDALLRELHGKALVGTPLERARALDEYVRTHVQAARAEERAKVSAAPRGDVCGCPDDRCVGHHHAEGDPCPCVAALGARRG